MPEVTPIPSTRPVTRLTDEQAKTVSGGCSVLTDCTITPKSPAPLHNSSAPSLPATPLGSHSPVPASLTIPDAEAPYKLVLDE